MLKFFKDDEEIRTRDYLVYIDPEKRVGDVVAVSDVNHERVLGGDLQGQSYSVPVGDLSVMTGSRGRVFIYNAPTEMINETKRLAELEKSTVFSQLSQYREPEQKTDKFKIVLMSIIVIQMFLIAFAR